MNERVIVTERLTLRPPVVDDAEAIVDAYTADPEVTKYLLFLPYDDAGMARAFLQAKLDEMAHGRSMYWLIVPRAEHHVIGAIDLRLVKIPATSAMSLQSVGGAKGSCPKLCVP